MAAPQPPIFYAPPVTSGLFSYHPSTGLQVTLVETPSQHFTRASSRDLYKLLTYTAPTGPELTKTGRIKAIQPGVVKDQSASFYQAQMIHYGLKPLKTKEAAKKALLRAFESAEGTTLKVPKEVAKEAKVLKDRYLVANVVAKKEQEANDKRFGKVGPATAAAAKPAQTKVVKEKKAVKEVQSKSSSQGQSSQVSENAPYHSSQTGVYFKGSITIDGVILCECGEPAIFLKTKKVGQNTGRCFYKCDQKTKCATFLWQDDADKALSNLGIAPTSSIPANDTYGGGSSQSQSHTHPQQERYSSSPPPSPPPAQAPRKKQTARKRGGLSPTWIEPAPGGSSGMELKRGNAESWTDGSGGSPAKKTKPSKSSDGEMVTFADEYTFSEHDLGEGHYYCDLEDFSLSLAYSTSYGHLWGAFDFGVVSGYMRSIGALPPLASTAAAHTIRFHWRGRAEEGESYFSRDQIISITFEKIIMGRWVISGAMDFMGKQYFRGSGEMMGNRNPANTRKRVQSWKKEYYDLTMANYEREEEERWRGSTWGRNFGSERREANSDSD